eukprot:TRINITY_DN63526_c0_g1_i1.p1 TRINITY_DN63526_c0_g1~~TRINITY_DN63526_c0_g1_i1.p1  ORF type:complete len:371 (+),score=43.91 TRINITY_DN63526_c0_g1_i1:65-1177(+)
MAEAPRWASGMTSQVADEELTPDGIVKWLVMSLYLDEVVPRGPLLQWLLQVLVGIKVNHRQLRNYIEAASGVYADPPDAKKLSFTALLKEPPPGFAGFVSEQDVSAAALGDDIWQEVSTCLARGGWSKPEDAAHKHYVVALWLQDSSERLSALSFGRVLSIVRSSLSTAGLLGHRGGFLVPYAHSEECERRINACTGQPTHVAPDENYVKTWAELKDLLFKLIHASPDGLVEVCKLKGLMRSTFKTELSETVFGHQSLSKLLVDPQLGEEIILSTSAQGNRYTLGLRGGSAAVSAAAVAAAAVQAATRPPPGLAPVQGHGGAHASVPRPVGKVDTKNRAFAKASEKLKAQAPPAPVPPGARPLRLAEQVF